METWATLMMVATAFGFGYFLGRTRARDGDSWREPAAAIDPKALDLARRVLPLEGKIGAIKAYREATGVGLRDAKLAVDTLDDER